MNDNNTSKLDTILRLSEKLGPLFALFLVIALFGILEPQKFLSFKNFSNVAGQTAVIAVAAVGMTFVIISAGIDLSAGSVIAFTGVCAAMTISAQVLDMNIYLGILAGLISGAACGAFNGIVITKGSLPPFIVTLGMLEIVRGTSYYITDGLPVTDLREGFSDIGNSVWTFSMLGRTLEIPYSVFILIPVALLGGFLLKYTVFGVHVYAVGSNEQTAKLCGVNVNRVKVLVYIICGVTAGLAGIMQASRLSTGQPSTAIGLELDIIAAVVVGGASLMGGSGSILGSIVGAFIIRFLRNGCVLVGVESFVQRIIIGFIIIAAVFVDQLRRKRMAVK